MLPLHPEFNNQYKVVVDNCIELNVSNTVALVAGQEDNKHCLFLLSRPNYGFFFQLSVLRDYVYCSDQDVCTEQFIYSPHPHTDSFKAVLFYSLCYFSFT